MVPSDALACERRLRPCPRFLGEWLPGPGPGQSHRGRANSPTWDQCRPNLANIAPTSADVGRIRSADVRKLAGNHSGGACSATRGANSGASFSSQSDAEHSATSVRRLRRAALEHLSSMCLRGRVTSGSHGVSWVLPAATQAGAPGLDLDDHPLFRLVASPPEGGSGPKTSVVPPKPEESESTE